MEYVGTLLLLLASTAHAGELHRCVGPGRHVSYQSAACPAGHRTDRTIAFTTESMPPTVRRARREAGPNRPMRRVVSHAKATKAARVDPCRQAKAKREQVLSRLGLKRTYDQLSRIDEAVRTVCKGY